MTDFKYSQAHYDLLRRLNRAIRALTDEAAATVLAIAERVPTQDNASTAEPVFLVRQRRRVYGIDVDWTDNIVWLDSGNDSAEIDGEEAEALELEYQKTGAIPDEYARVGYGDEMEFVQAFFTRAAAEAYIDSNRHRLCEPEVYVDSGYRNAEWIALRALFGAVGRVPAKRWAFTFCLNDEVRKNRYVVFEGTEDEARDKMVARYGTHWAFQYEEAKIPDLLSNGIRPLEPEYERGEHEGQDD